MRGRVTAVLGAAAMVLMASAASAQAPNMAGKWTVDAEKTAASNPAPQGGQGGRGGMGMMGAGTLTIDASTLVIERAGRDGEVMKTEYKLDGSEQNIAMGQMSAKAKAKWDGAALVVETTREGQNGAMTTKQTYAIEGDWLVSSSTRNGRDGTPVTTKVYYKKAN